MKSTILTFFFEAQNTRKNYYWDLNPLDHNLVFIMCNDFFLNGFYGFTLNFHHFDIFNKILKLNKTVQTIVLHFFL